MENPIASEEILRFAQNDNFTGGNIVAKNHRPASLFDLQLDSWLHGSGSKPKPPKGSDIERVMLGGKPLTQQRGDEVFGKSKEVPGDLLSAFESEVTQ